MAVKSAYMSRKGGKAEKTDLNNSGFSAEEELHAYRDMLLIRRFEEKAGQLYGMGLIGGFCHLYIGQEAVVVGMQMALEAGRPGHHRLSRPRPHAGLRHGPQGRDGRADRPRAAAIPRARAARCTCSSREKQFFGGHGIVGAQVPLGAGLAFANKYRGNDNVCAHLFRRRRGQPGPGLRDLQHGRALEAAGDLRHREQPYAMGTARRARPRRSRDFSKRGAAFGIPGEQVDGMDVRAVKAAGDKAVAHVPRRQRALHPGDDDLPLSRPLDVRPGEVPHARGSAEDARGARSDRAGARPASCKAGWPAKTT